MESRAPAAVLRGLIENERCHEDSVASGQPYAAVEEDRNDKRAELEAKLFALPTRTPVDVAIKLQALWPDVAVNRSYDQPPSEQHDLAVQRMWGLIQSAKSIAEEFSDGLAAFNELALPNVPTAIVEAGAQAAGVTPERFRAGCEAAAAALKRKEA
ncbi:hypothetical protein ABMY26_07050 (plasmid) [Azospirillum sp. HJ39]|uniref:hypothetical protein n=1 Tax=Azospirillum sp. HJ39 TaxID=3159496 RepID=UPI003555C92A